jgi:hypothetical protein
MLTATVLAVFFVPVFYVGVQELIEALAKYPGFKTLLSRLIGFPVGSVLSQLNSEKVPKAPDLPSTVPDSVAHGQSAEGQQPEREGVPANSPPQPPTAS